MLAGVLFPLCSSEAPFCLTVCALGYFLFLANCLCYFKNLHIIVCLGCMCRGDHVPEGILIESGSLVSAVLCSSWPVSIPVQYSAGLLGQDHSIWLYTWLTEFELQSSGLWGSYLSAEPSFWPLIYFTLEMGSYYVSWSAQTFSCSRGWPWVWDPALAFWVLSIQVYAVTSNFRYLSFHRPPPSIHKDICAPQSWALIYSTKLRRRVHVWMSRFLFLLL